MTRRIGSRRAPRPVGAGAIISPLPSTRLEQVAGDLAGLHSSDPATVYLSLRARVKGFRNGDLDAALYDRRSLLRLLGMRRTMFVVPLDLAAEMDASCARGLGAAATPAGCSSGSPSRRWATTPGWRRWSGETMDALASMGRPPPTSCARSVPELRTQLSFGEGTTAEGTVGLSTRILFLLAVEGRHRANPAQGDLGVDPVSVGPDGGLGTGWSCRDSMPTTQPPRCSPVAGCVRPGNRNRSGLVDRLGCTQGPGSARRDRRRRGRSRSGNRFRARRRPRPVPASEPVGSAAPWSRPHHDGVEANATGISGPTTPSCSIATETPVRRCGPMAGSSADGANGTTARSSSRCSNPSVPTRRTWWLPRPPLFRIGWETFVSRPDFRPLWRSGCGGEAAALQVVAMSGPLRTPTETFPPFPSIWTNSRSVG